MTTMQQATRTVIETGAQVKMRNVVQPDWMKALVDEKKYLVVKLFAPFGIYVIAATPACPACQGTGLFKGIDAAPATCCECDGTGVEKK